MIIKYSVINGVRVSMVKDMDGFRQEMNLDNSTCTYPLSQEENALLVRSITVVLLHAFP